MRSGLVGTIGFWAGVALGLSAGCGGNSRTVELVPALDDCLGGRRVNELRLSGLGDFAPDPAAVASAPPMGTVRLALPKGTRVIAVDGFGPSSGSGGSGLVAFGRTAALSDADLGARVPVIYGPPDGLCRAGALHYPRAQHRATLLPSGNVLISGGLDSSGGPVERLELFLPSGDALTQPGHFRIVDQGGTTVIDPAAALGHAAAALPSGELLVTGGVGAASELPSGIAFSGFTRHATDGTATGAPGLLGGGGRAFHSATSLADGRVLLAGGCAEFAAGSCSPGRALATTELFDPATGRFSPGPSLARPRWDHDALLLGDGAVLLVGGVGEGSGPLPVEVFDPTELRDFDAGLASGRAARFPTGGVLIAGGTHGAASADASLWLASADAGDPNAHLVPLAPLPLPATGQTLTPLDDGAILLAGGSATPGFAPLLILDGRNAPLPLTAQFAARGHSATRLLDGTVLLAGGSGLDGIARADAFVYLRSPLGPYASLPTLALDAADAPLLPRRADRASFSGPFFSLTAPAPGPGGRPGELALVRALDLADFTLSVSLGRSGPAGAALLFGWSSEASFAFVALEPGAPVALSAVNSPRAGQSVVTPDPSCVGVPLDASELPDGAAASLQVEQRLGALVISTAARTLLRCTPAPPLGRGAVGFGVLHGTATFQAITVTR